MILLRVVDITITAILAGCMLAIRNIYPDEEVHIAALWGFVYLAVTLLVLILGVK